MATSNYAPTAMGATQKEIKRNRATGDFDLYYQGRYVGSRATHREAETELDELAYEELRRAA